MGVIYRNGKQYTGGSKNFTLVQDEKDGHIIKLMSEGVVISTITVPDNDTRYFAGDNIRIDENNVISALGSTTIRLADVSGASVAVTSKNKVGITWTDPNDVEVSGVLLAQWAGTKIVRKKGSAPNDDSDGTLIIDSKTKNAYSSTAFVDTLPEYEETYYYRFFPYTYDGVVTSGSSESVNATRESVTIPSATNLLHYNGGMQTEIFTNYDSTKMSVTGNGGIDAGDYTATFHLLDDYYKWSNGSLSDQEVAWTLNKASLNVPEVTADLIYDTTSKSPTITGYDSNTMTQSGSDSEVNAGTYTLMYTLNDTNNYEWSDSSISAKEKTWEIKKANGGCTLTPSSITLDSDNTSGSCVISGATGEITGISVGDSSLISATLSGNTININTVDESSGSTNITVNIAESDNYKSASVNLNVDCAFTVIYGVEWDGTSTTKWSRTDGAIDFVDPSPAINNGTGSSPFDNISPWKDMVVEERTAGTMVKIPKFYYKWEKSGTKEKLQISMNQEDGFRCSPAHMDRGDGKGERDVVYIGRYHCATSTYKSTTGVQPQASVTRANFRTSIHKLGSNIWQNDYAMRLTILMLYLVEFADWNSQLTIGYGCSPSGSKFNMGYTDAMQYHTGTTAANRTTYGGTQYRNIEGLWDNVRDWCDGIYFSGANIFAIKNPASFSDSSGGTNVGFSRPTSSGWISAWGHSNVSGFEYFMYPNAVSGSETTYICDYCYYSSSGVVLYVGGNCGQGQYYGLSYLYGNVSASNTSGGIGSRCMELT